MESAEAERVCAGPLEELFEGLPARKTLSLSGRTFDVVLCRVGDRVFALENECSHQQVFLHRGFLRGCELVCPAHGARFDLETGQPRSGPAREPIMSFPVELIDGEVWITLPARGGARA